MKHTSLQWKIGGEAGFGIMTTGLIFSRICARGGLKVFAYPEYPSLIRGGHNTYQVTIDVEEATSQIHDVHILVALNKKTIELHLNELADSAVIIYDPADFQGMKPDVKGKNVKLVAVPMTEIIKTQHARSVARNTISIGASFGVLDYSWEEVEHGIRDWFHVKKPEFVDANVLLAKEGYAVGNREKNRVSFQLEKQVSKIPQVVLSGNGAIAMGALAAGMKLYAAYPMTPSSDILSYLASKEKTMNIVVKQTEDEIAAINMIIGAGFAGIRAMTATSGGGFALMTEALGLAALAEVPIVVVMGQRPGPSTGLPTWTSQSDLRFVLHASQGEFPRIVLAPGDQEECFDATFRAFNLAEKYQTPVIILADKYVQESWSSFSAFDTSLRTVDRGKLLTQKELNAIIATNKKYIRHQYTDDGISSRAIPGMKGCEHVASSYEHEESGYTTEDEQETTKQNDKRMKKMSRFLIEDAQEPMVFGQENAKWTIVGWGSTKQTALAAVRRARTEELSLNYIHFSTIMPLPIEKIQKIFAKTHKTLCVEGNKFGQFESYLYEHTGITMTASMHKYGGRPFYPEEILERIRALQ